MCMLKVTGVGGVHAVVLAHGRPCTCEGGGRRRSEREAGTPRTAAHAGAHPPQTTHQKISHGVYRWIPSTRSGRPRSPRWSTAPLVNSSPQTIPLYMKPEEICYIISAGSLQITQRAPGLLGTGLPSVWARLDHSTRLKQIMEARTATLWAATGVNRHSPSLRGHPSPACAQCVPPPPLPPGCHHDATLTAFWIPPHPTVRGSGNRRGSAQRRSRGGAARAAPLRRGCPPHNHPACEALVPHA
jgi:hypothetical protein